MEVLKNKRREFKIVDTPDGIDRILSKYVDLNNLYIKDSPDRQPAPSAERINKNKLKLNIDLEGTQETITLYTVSTRYIEFDLSIDTNKEEFTGNGVLMNIDQCRIATDKREHQRINSEDWDLHLNHITIMDVHEKPSDIIKSVKFKVFFTEYEKKLEYAEFDYKKLFFINDKDLSAEMQYAINKEEQIFIEDLKNTQVIIDEDDRIFVDKPQLLKDLNNRITELKNKYQSLLIKPINYTTISEKTFPVCYIMIATKERKITSEDIKRIDDNAEEIIEKIHDASQEVHDVKTKVLNISPSGAMMEITDRDLAKAMSNQKWAIFSLVFKLQQPIKISGEIEYVLKQSNDSYLAGVYFKGSKFGLKTKKMLENHIAKWMRDHKALAENTKE